MSSTPNQTSRILRFSVVGDPAPQPRQRHRIISPKDKKAFVHNYTPADSKVNQWKQAVQEAARKIIPEGFTPFDEALGINAIFLMPRPKYLLTKNAPESRIHFTRKPDTDNLIKAVKDCLTSILWRDDALVCIETVMKYYRASNEQAGVILTVMPLE